MKKWLIIGLVSVIGFALVIAKICFFTTRKAAVRLSQSTSCELRTDGFYHLFTDQQMPLVCWRDGQEIGRVEFAFDADWFRTAIFPTQDKHKLICFSQTDLTIALFVIDLEQRSESKYSATKEFFVSEPSIIKSTTLPLRRCAKDEVAQLKQYIESIDDHTLGNSWVSLMPYVSNPGKEWLLTKIDHVTNPSHVPSAGEIPAVKPE